MSNINVCIIEDSPAISKLFSTVLKKAEFTTEVFKSGNEALDWLQKNKPDIILMDILLPDYSGTELIKDVRAIEGFDKIPIVAVTGFTSSSEKDKYINLGFDSFLSKPVNIATFASDIQKVLDNNK